MAALALAVSIRIKPEHVERFMAAVEENGRAARESEPGCQVFDILVDPQDRTQVLLYEVYADEAALDAHQNTPHFKKYLESAVPLLASRERRVLRRVAP